MVVVIHFSKPFSCVLNFSKMFFYHIWENIIRYNEMVNIHVYQYCIKKLKFTSKPRRLVIQTLKNYFFV